MNDYKPKFEGLNPDDYVDPPFEKVSGVGTVEKIEVGEETSNGSYPVRIHISGPEDSPNARIYGAEVSAIFFEPKRMGVGANNSDLTPGQQTSMRINLSKLNSLTKVAADLSFVAAAQADFEAVIGKRVGFSLGPGFKDPTRPEWGKFTKPKA
jgi:hypothetical protein